MNTLSWRNSRLLLLRICSVALVGTVSYIFLKPQQDVFHNLSISNQWETVDRHEIEIVYQVTEKKEYREKNNHNLGLEVILIPILREDVLTLIKSHLGFNLKSQDLKVIEDKDIGSYGLFTQNKAAYLSTCIHPQGKTAFSNKQFTELATHNLRDRILPWVLGLADFRDWRCFWVNISVDLEDISEKEATKLLQEKLAYIVSQSKF